MSDNIQVMKIKERVDNQLKFTKDGKEYYGKYVFVMENMYHILLEVHMRPKI